MKIIFMGTPDFAAAPLEALCDHGYDVVLAVTRQDTPKGRGREMSFSPVKTTALAHGVPVLQPVKMKDPALWETLRSCGADLFVVAAYGRILPKEILSIPPMGCVNIHASLLPAYRGAAPIQWAIMDGQKETGITTMLMDEGLDTGDILRQYRIPISDTETGGSLFDRLASLGCEAILDTIEGLKDGSITPVKQGEPTTGYASMLTKDTGNIDWTRPAEELERTVRALSPWPSAFSYLDGKLFKFWRARVLKTGNRETAAEPGTILTAAGSELAVQTGDGVLLIDELQQQGKKRMETGAYLRGARLKPGDRFAGA